VASPAADPLNELNEARIAAFLKARWKRLASHCGIRYHALLLRHLRQAKVVAPPPLTNGSDLELMILEYQGFLLSERSLMPSTTGKYLEATRRFLFRRFPDGKLYLKKLQAKDVTDFVLHDTSHRGRRSAQLMATVLRSFLSFLLQKRQDRNESGSGGALDTPPTSSRSAALLGDARVEMVLRSCDRRRKIGKRDYAIFLLLARLGLRANEVVLLTLDDIDWRKRGVADSRQRCPGGPLATACKMSDRRWRTI